MNPREWEEHEAARETAREQDEIREKGHDFHALRLLKSRQPSADLLAAEAAICMLLPYAEGELGTFGGNKCRNAIAAGRAVLDARDKRNARE